MPLARPHSSKPSSRQTRHCLAGISTTQFKVVHSSDGGGLAGVGVPNENRFRLCGASFNPARAFLHALFYWKGDLVPRFRREQDYQHPGAETPRYSYRLAATTPSLSGGASGTPNLRRCRIRPARFSPDHVLPRDSCSYGKGNSCSCSVASNVIGQKGSGHDCRCHLLLLRWPCIPGGCTDGTPNLRISVRCRFCPGRSQRPLLLSVRIHHVLARVVKALSNPWYRLAPGFSTSPFRANHANTGMLAEWNSDRFLVLAHLCRCLSGGAFSFPVALSRDYLHISSGPPTRTCFSAWPSDSPRFLRPR